MIKRWLQENGRGLVTGFVLAFLVSGVWLLYHEWSAWVEVRDFVRPIIQQQRAQEAARRAVPAESPAGRSVPGAEPSRQAPGPQPSGTSGSKPSQGEGSKP